MSLSIFLVDLLISIFIAIFVIFILSKNANTILNSKTVLVLFFLGLLIAPLVSGSLLYPRIWYVSITGIFVTYIVIPSLISVSVLDRRRVSITDYFVFIMLSEIVTMAFRLPHPFQPPREPWIKISITASFLVFSDLLSYLIATFIPLLFCHIHSKTQNQFLRALLILSIPFSLILTYSILTYVTGGML